MVSAARKENMAEGCDHSFQTPEGLDQLYESKRPTAKKIIKLFQGEPLTDAERQSLDYLKKFVKSLERKAFSMFLRFGTGSDVITCDSIRICLSLSVYRKGSRDALWLVRVFPFWIFLHLTNLSRLLLKSSRIP